ncbi:MAG: rod shape-determining protein MreD [Acidobacteriia bacterium]|nr:rod shape-determining protein MreD [Terriglobia bacterium]
MATPIQRPVEVFRMHPAALWVTALVALLLQAVLPLTLPLARLFDFPLLVTIYFAVIRRNKIFAIGLGTGMGLLQDALSSGLIGFFGMAKGLVAYLAASASVKFELDDLFGRMALTATLVPIHALFLKLLQRGLLESPPPWQALDVVSGSLVNVGLGLILFQILDRFRRPA